MSSLCRECRTTEVFPTIHCLECYLNREKRGEKKLFSFFWRALDWSCALFMQRINNYWRLCTNSMTQCTRFHNISSFSRNENTSHTIQLCREREWEKKLKNAETLLTFRVCSWDRAWWIFSLLLLLLLFILLISRQSAFILIFLWRENKKMFRLCVDSLCTKKNNSRSWF